MGYIIDIQDVWKTFKLGDTEVHAVQGLNFKIKEKEFVAIQGPSGSGKSTTFNMIGCLDFPTKGKIFLDNQDITTLAESTLARIRGRKIGFVFQTFNLIPSLTALENVALPMIFQNTPKEKRIEKAQHLLTQVNLQHRLNHKPGEMSGGERQRVAIARALVNDPEVILADEPTGNLDTKTGEKIMDIFKALHKDHQKTIVMVTHESDIAKHAKRKVFLRDGRLFNHA